MLQVGLATVAAENLGYRVLRCPDNDCLRRRYILVQQIYHAAQAVDHDLHRPDEIGAGQEKEPGGCREGDDQIERHVNNVVRDDHCQREGARHGRKQQKEK